MKTLNRPFGAYPNRFTSIDKLDAGGTVDVLEAREDLDEDNNPKTACDWVDDGAMIVGGCCEIGPKYINALNNALQENGHKIVSELK